jgi:hypothetical protein
MKRLFLVAPLLALVAAAAVAAAPDFDAIVRGVESAYGLHRVHVPLFGLARFVVKVARPEGVKDFDMAIFEADDRTPADSRRFDSIMRRAAGDRWSGAIHLRSRDEGGSTYVYFRSEGRDWRMLVATFKPGAVVILHARVDSEIVLRALDDPEHAGQSLGGDY